MPKRGKDWTPEDGLLYYKQLRREMRKRIRREQILRKEAIQKCNQILLQIFNDAMKQLKASDYSVIDEHDIEKAFQPILQHALYEKKLTMVSSLLSALKGSITEIELKLNELERV